MWVCICNAKNDRHVATAIAAVCTDASVRVADVYAAMGCRAKCGRCTPEILDRMRQSLAANAPSGTGRSATACAAE